MDSTDVTRAELASYLKDTSSHGFPCELAILSVPRMRTIRAKYRGDTIRELLYITTDESGILWDAPVDECHRYAWMPSFWVGEHGKEHRFTQELTTLYEPGDVLDPATLHAIALRRGPRPDYDYARWYAVNTLNTVHDRLLTADGTHLTTGPVLDDPVHWAADTEDDTDNHVDVGRAQLVRAWVEGYDPLGDSVPRGGMPSDEQYTWLRYDGSDDAQLIEHAITALRATYVKYAGVPRT